MESTQDAQSPLPVQNLTTEDLLKSQTVGLVNLSDFRKRRAEILEQKDHEFRTNTGLRTSTPLSLGTSKDRHQPLKTLRKKRKIVNKGKLSFSVEDEEESIGHGDPRSPLSNQKSYRAEPANIHKEFEGNDKPTIALSKRVGPNTAFGPAPKAMTKSAMDKEARTREKIRKEYLLIQGLVKDTEIRIPFTFYDGTSIPGGICKMKKGDHIWLFLDRSRKVGAELGVGAGDKSKRDWARVGVDDLMLVRGEIIIPHHYDFYYFIANRIYGFNGLLFDYTAHPLLDSADIEGSDDDPTSTKVVDRRWYERNKHIFPASIWEEFDPSKDYTKGIRKDLQGNTFFMP